MAEAGEILVRTLRMLESKVRPGVTTAELDAAAERYIRSQGAVPAFKGYRGFPGSICTSPNSMVVHGIPGPYQLSRGDIISIDVGVVHDGWVADAARTFPVGPVSPVASKLLDATVSELMDPPFPMVDAQQSVDAIAKLLSKSNPAVLVRSNGHVLGIVTRSDMPSYLMARG